MDSCEQIEKGSLEDKDPRSPDGSPLGARAQEQGGRKARDPDGSLHRARVRENQHLTANQVYNRMIRGGKYCGLLLILFVVTATGVCYFTPGCHGIHGMHGVGKGQDPKLVMVGKRFIRWRTRDQYWDSKGNIWKLCCVKFDWVRRIPKGHLTGYTETDLACKIKATMFFYNDTVGKPLRFCIPREHTVTKTLVSRLKKVNAGLSTKEVVDDPLFFQRIDESLNINQRDNKPIKNNVDKAKVYGTKVFKSMGPVGNPKKYEEVPTVPHHWALMYKYGQLTGQKENCWVCSKIHSNEGKIPVIGLPVTLPQFVAAAGKTPMRRVTRTDRPVYFRKFSKHPNLCFLNGVVTHEGQIANGEWCRESVMNMTIRNVAAWEEDKSLEIEGLGIKLTEMNDGDERVGNMSLYNISHCFRMRKPNDTVNQVLSSLHNVSTPWISPQSEFVPLVDWMCLTGLRTPMHGEEVVEAPHLPQGFMVCCGLACHTTIPYPTDRNTGGWCSLMYMVPYMGVASGETMMEMNKPSGSLKIRSKRDVTSLWEKLLTLLPGGSINALTRVDEFSSLVMSWMNKTDKDITDLNEETYKIRLLQEMTNLQLEKMGDIVVGLCILHEQADMCCTFMKNLTKAIGEITVPDYHDQIEAHHNERMSLVNQMQHMGDAWDPFSGSLGGLWPSIVGFFKKAGIFIIMILLLALCAFLSVKMIFCIIGKTTGLKIKQNPESSQDSQESFMLKRQNWYSE
ncbi:uncharacterized protein LOC120937265 [Rana temporaria]|uniref:uncharacterized protein LOC120937265 n=1 Tax=Rana temporaria TaxID=8407 RepID=UPI001AACE923|nr:uncharacterized protein LOC120937265 [Rana temporaria]